MCFRYKTRTHAYINFFIYSKVIYPSKHFLRKKKISLEICTFAYLQSKQCFAVAKIKQNFFYYIFNFPKMFAGLSTLLTGIMFTHHTLIFTLIIQRFSTLIHIKIVFVFRSYFAFFLINDFPVSAFQSILCFSTNIHPAENYAGVTNRCQYCRNI